LGTFFILKIIQGVIMMPNKAKRELRVIELRALDPAPDSNEMIVEGRAVVYDSPTVMWEYDGIKYYEVIQRGALDEADMSDVPFKYNHSDNVMIMARTRNKTLELTKDDQGLLIRAKLADTTAGRDLYTLIKRGDIDKMSFAFTVKEDAYDRDTHTRKINKIKKIWDVAAVDIPAYDDTSISARSWAEAQREIEAAEAAGSAEADQREAEAIQIEILKYKAQILMKG
jgi:HK97 family phage prohead protease